VLHRPVPSRLFFVLPLVAASLVPLPRDARACTSVLVSKGATRDSASMVTYAADSHELYGDLVLRPATINRPGTPLDVVEWDTGKVLGVIPQAAKTYSVVGHINEKQVVVAESTFGGRPELVDPTGIVDYGSLMYLALQRAATAREAVKVMTDLVAEHGYASSGESFSIADPNEAWLLEMIGKGPGNKGALWVARKVPDGMVTAHANQARIRRFPLKDPDTLYAKDVISFARAKGWFKGKDEEFSFAETYAPLDFEAARFCEARVWSVFSRVAPSLKLPVDYAMGKPGAAPLPLWVKPDAKLATEDVMALMRDHFEGTPMDMSIGAGAGPYRLPYRWRPLTWEAGGKKYLNERAISTQQTGFSFVSQSRANLPDAIGGVLWFGVDDTYSTVWVPMYAGIRQAPPSFAPGVASLGTFSWDSAFWVFNWVANFTYSRYSEMIPEVQKVQRELEGDFLGRQAAIEQAALKLHASSPEQARDYLTEYSVGQAERTTKRWKKLGEDLLVKFMDGNLKDEHGAVRHPGYSVAWRDLVAKLDGARIEVPKAPTEAKPILIGGYFHTKDELGALASAVPADFPFATEKLVLVAGTDKCQRPPVCCVVPKAGAEAGQLLAEAPKSAGPEGCGAPSFFVRVAKAETRTLVLADGGH
jgi:dipeptidase